MIGVTAAASAGIYLGRATSIRGSRLRDRLGASTGDLLGRVGQQFGQRGKRPAILSDRAHLEPVSEEHDRDQGRELPPDLDLEDAERAGPAQPIVAAPVARRANRVPEDENGIRDARQDEEDSRIPTFRFLPHGGDG